MRFEIETDRPLIANDSRSRYVLATIVAPEGAPRQRPPVNLALVIDRSGSMGGDKIRLAKDAAVAAIRRLDSRDRFCVVIFDGHIDVIVPSVVANAHSVADAVRAIMQIEARGSTDLCGGWLKACEQVALSQSPVAVTRLILLTDGQANVGVTDTQEIIGHAGELRRRGVTTTTVGVGEDFDEHLLGPMADEGGGHFYYVERDEQILRAIETEVGESLEVTVRGAQLRIGPAAFAMVAPIAPFPTRRDGNVWVIELGDLASMQELKVPIRIAFGSHGLGGQLGSEVRMSFAVGGAAGVLASAEVVWTLATGHEVGAQRRNRRVDRAVAQAYASVAQREAGRFNRDGDYVGARTQIHAVAARIAEYAGDDAELNGLVQRLKGDAEEHGAMLTASDLKRRYMTSERTFKGRDEHGASTRRPNRPRA